jgi:hypothetical protein
MFKLLASIRAASFGVPLLYVGHPDARHQDAEHQDAVHQNKI